MADPLVTVIMPSLGRLTYLRESQESLERQTLTDREVLVLDNAAPPEGATALQEWANSQSDVRVLRVEDRLPVFANFNRGVQAARGRYVVFFHDDDRYDARFLEFMVEQMEKIPDADIGGCNYRVIDGHGRDIEARRPFAETGAWSGRRFIERVIGTGRCPIPMQGVIYRRRAIGASFHAQLETHFGDFALLMRLAEGRRVAVRSEALLEWRKHLGAASSIPHSRAIPIRERVLDDYLGDLRARHVDPFWTTRLRARHAMAHRAAVAYGWASAEDTNEARKCAALLGRTPIDRVASLLMKAVSGTFLRPQGASRIARELLTR